MNENVFSSSSPQQPIKKSGWGCVAIGCLSVFVLMLVVFIGGGVGGYFFVKSQIVRYTSEAPRELPKVEFSKEENKALKAKIANFKEALEKNEQAESLVLTAEDLNALIAENENLKDKVFIRLEDGKASADLSFPTDAFPLAKGRYFNGSVGLNVSLNNGVLVVTLDDAEVNELPVPEAIVKQMRGENLAKDLYKNPETAATVSKLDKVTIEKGKITISPRAPNASESQKEISPAASSETETKMTGQ